MFDPKSYCKACDKLTLDAGKMKEMITMTENTGKKPVRRPTRVVLVAAALAAALGITASAAELPAVQEFFATIFVTVTADGEAAGLTIPSVAVEKREGRSILVVDGEETDITDALAQDGKYLYEGDGFEVAVDENGVAVVTSYGDNGMTVRYSTEDPGVQGGVVYKVTSDDEDLTDYNVSVDVAGTEAPEETDSMSTYEITVDDSGAVNVKSAVEK